MQNYSILEVYYRADEVNDILTDTVDGNFKKSCQVVHG